jgi:uncharacterized protein (DUF2147 family)
MRLDSLLLAGLLTLSMAGPGMTQTPPADLSGVWRTIDDRDGQPRALVRIERRDGVYVGVLAGSLRGDEQGDARCTRCRGALKNAPMRGLPFLRDLREASEGVYDGGRIVDPDSGAEYSCRATLAPDAMSLSVRGFIGIPALGRSQRWERLS